MKSEEWPTCAFCRTALPKSDEEILARLGERVDRKDPLALHNMAMDFGLGQLGLAVDQAKCIDLLRESACLGCPVAQAQLGNFYHCGDMGIQQDKEEALKYFKEAAEGGNVYARHNAGMTEGRNGNDVAAMGHLRLSASVGNRDSMEALISCFECCLLRHADLAETVQAFYLARAEMRSKDRDYYINHLKMTGKYKEEYVR